MSVFEGKVLQVKIEGESHSPAMRLWVKGMPSFAVDKEALKAFLARRKASSALYSTQRIEEDAPLFEGLAGDRIEGDFGVTIENNNVKSEDYKPLRGIPRPSHADYAWYCKDGTLDFAGGGRFSGRLTAPLCVAGGIAVQYLQTLGVQIRAYIASIGTVCGRSYKDKDFDVSELQNIKTGALPTLGDSTAMEEEIAQAKRDGDSVGGRVECIVTGYPQGIGDNLFGGLEGKIASLVYAVPAVKGVEFGFGFDLARALGSQANDPLYWDEQGKVAFGANRSGGINGGISNGNYLSLGVAVKPTPSIAKEQTSVDLVAHRTVQIRIGGRHDACIAPRAVVVIESAVALALLDELLAQKTR